MSNIVICLDRNNDSVKEVSIGQFKIKLSIPLLKIITTIIFNAHKNEGTTDSFYTFKWIKLFVAGLLSPSAHPLSNPAIWSVLAHLEKSAVGIAYLLPGVSITSGRMVIIPELLGISIYRVNEWIVVLANA